jgi:hypothetical protein
LSAKLLIRCNRHILSVPDVVFVLSARYFLLTDNHYQQHKALQSRNCTLLGRNLHKSILQTTSFNFWYIILIAILFHCSTVNFKVKPHDFSTADLCRHILIIFEFFSQPWGWSHDWPKHVGEHYAIHLHPRKQSPFVGILIYFMYIRMDFIFVWIILGVPWVVRILLVFLYFLLVVNLKWGISPCTDVILWKNICLLISH